MIFAIGINGLTLVGALMMIFGLIGLYEMKRRGRF